MAQSFVVIRCYACSTFQVHQVKKSKTWVCKLCGEKQSRRKVFAEGNGTECRHHVQKLNMASAVCGKNSEQSEYQYDVVEKENVTDCDVLTVARKLDDRKLSKWLDFVSDDSNSGDDGRNVELVGETNYTTDRQVFVQSRRKRCQKGVKTSRSKVNRDSSIHALHSKTLATTGSGCTSSQSEINGSTDDGVRVKKHQEPLDSKHKLISVDINPTCRLSDNSKWSKFVSQENRHSDSDVENSNESSCLTSVQQLHSNDVDPTAAVTYDIKSYNSSLSASVCASTLFCVDGDLEEEATDFTVA
ncbi:uncharacterized protein LOC134195487 isoform X2 [Corticium candelabrum]|uniref:uncharacterized protein LOC134195487 isoform X2 n=1 Tax=Corticium candelabrum TaxID=121492 RepID=UPI002E2734C6|nr:uncharacterized protein LOC134195487 isoform X2 [Corticium candelabrum]